jgi:hypothetical protein
MARKSIRRSKRSKGSKRSKRSKKMISRKVSKGVKTSLSSDKRRCNTLLSNRVRKNIAEYQTGKVFYSAKEPLAVAYEQVSKMHPECQKYYVKLLKKYKKTSH